METLSLYYFSEVAKDLHITRTANRLYISQQTLSNHLARLEEHFGMKLLHRKPSLSLTYAGEYVLAFAERINRENLNINDILADIRQEDRGLILFGASTLRMATLLPDILPVFSARYPHVEIRITDEHSRKLEELVLGGELDLAVSVPGADHSKITKASLMADQIYICVTDSLLETYYGEAAAHLKKSAKDGVNLKSLSLLPFCILDNRLGKTIQNCFDEAGFMPRVYAVSAHIQVSNSISFTGLAASFATRTSLHNLRGTIAETVNVFPVIHQGRPLIQQSTIIHHKERYLSRYNQYFYELIMDYFRRLEQLPVEQLVTTGLRNYAKLVR